jgi:hypothetical protein
MNFFLIFLTFSFSILACDDGFIKHNDIEIPLNSPLAGDITKDEYRTTLLKFEKFFKNSVEHQHNADLQIIVSWASNTVNAFAERSDDKWVITVFGGLARHKRITLDGLNLVLCHELGHHLGGHPKKTTNRWSSAEGQADYYSTSKCLRRLWKEENNIEIMGTKNVSALLVTECAKSYSSQAQQSLCQRIGLAGKSVALMIQELDHDSIEPKFETPDTQISRTMNYLYPFSQCRLDTFFSGAICTVSEFIDFDDDNEQIGSCNLTNGDLRGLRPRCWFVPR